MEPNAGATDADEFILVKNAKTESKSETDVKLFPSLIDNLRKGELNTRTEAARTITNVITGGNSDHIGYLIDEGCVPVLCDLLTEEDKEIVQVALYALDSILRLDNGQHENGRSNVYGDMIEACDGLEKIESLQSHSEQDIYRKAFDISSKYFSNTDREDDDLEQPETDERYRVH